MRTCGPQRPLRFFATRRMTLAIFFTFAMYIYQLTFPTFIMGWVVALLQRGAASLQRIDEILSVADTLRAARNVRAYLQEADAVTYPHLVRFVEGIAIFPELEERIEKTFNEQGAMRSTASPRLKSLRNEVQTLRGRIRGKLTTLMRSSGLAPYLQDRGIRESDGRPALETAVGLSASGPRREG